MVHQRHRAVGMVAALLLALTALTGCGASTTAADDVSEPTALPGAESEAKSTAQPESEQESEPESSELESEEPAPEPEPAEETPTGQTATDEDLDAYAAAAQKGLRKAFGPSFKKLYSEIAIVPVYPSGIEYDYTFRKAVDRSVARGALDAQAPTLRTQSRTVVIPEMERNGFEDPTVTFTYRNPDGSVVWSRTFS